MSPIRPGADILTLTASVTSLLAMTASVTPQLALTASVNANNPDAYIILAFPIQETAEDLVFSRPSPAGYVDADGEIQSAAVDTPRSAHYYEDGS